MKPVGSSASAPSSPSAVRRIVVPSSFVSKRASPRSRDRRRNGPSAACRGGCPRTHRRRRAGTGQRWSRRYARRASFTNGWVKGVPAAFFVLAERAEFHRVVGFGARLQIAPERAGTSVWSGPNNRCTGEPVRLLAPDAVREQEEARFVGRDAGVGQQDRLARGVGLCRFAIGEEMGRTVLPAPRLSHRVARRPCSPTSARPPARSSSPAETTCSTESRVSW